ncbi:endolytic peptidoglycan transglycosylase RlpA [Sodalis sp. dw_96]|uniref:endolytic peptidoglycan transglycosylase RlpA n=1 Tax=Sodalis sp. dw_96 TaxID=2719794 RepID=UPI001BD5B8CF|nr:endolytic peptidoglycan transglycosylase RlpA [Sodalis sp. dw_96]
MRKEWHWIGVIGLLLTACTTTTETPQQSAAPAAYNGPVVEISGVEPRYEPYNPNTGQDYQMDGKTYRIVKNPQNFSETGLASSYGAERSGNTTATGEPFDAQALTAAHPTLPLPSYVRVSNLSNGRQLVVRVNDRGPYTPGRIIDLSEAAAERLNISNQTTVKVDFIQVAPDGTLSGPGTIGTVVAKQTYALPPRPNLDGPSPGAMQPSSSAPVDDTRVSSGTGAVPAPTIRPVADPVTSSPDSPSAPSASGTGGGFLGSPSPLPAGVVESGEPSGAPATTYTPSHASAPTYTPSQASAAPAATYTKTHASAAAPVSGRFVVQVGALGDKQRALTWQKTLGQRFGVPGKVTANGNLYRVQLGPFSSRQQAAALQQRLSSEAQQQSFITTAAE